MSTEATFDIYRMLDRLNSTYENHVYGDRYSTGIIQAISNLLDDTSPTDEDINDYVHNLMGCNDQESNRSYVLRTAEKHVNGKRNVEYGDPISDFRTTADLWQTYISRTVEHRGTLILKPHDVAAMMMLLKVSRISWSSDVDDHWIDAAGYAACGYDCTQRQ